MIPFQQVQATSRVGQIAGQITEILRVKGSAVGDQLPSERRVAERFGVSRSKGSTSVEAEGGVRLSSLNRPDRTSGRRRGRVAEAGTGQPGSAKFSTQSQDHEQDQQMDTESRELGCPQTSSELVMTDIVKEFPMRRGESVIALDRMSFDIGKGEFVALLGPSGCGKSTVLRLAAGLDEPTSGTVTLSGGSPRDVARRQGLGVAFQEHALLPWATIEANVAIPFNVAGRPVDHDRIHELLELVGLSDFAKVRPRQLSGGMRQRASIARALILVPEILLLDEPFGALDAVTRRHMNIELQRIWSRNQISTMLVTHAVDEAAFLADRIVVMSARPGRVKTVCAVDFPRPREPELLRTPEFHDFVDDLTASLDAEPDTEGPDIS